jgi:hypothetical protein
LLTLAFFFKRWARIAASDPAYPHDDEENRRGAEHDQLIIGTQRAVRQNDWNLHRVPLTSTAFLLYTRASVFVSFFTMDLDKIKTRLKRRVFIQ